MLEEILAYNKQFVENKGYESYITNKYPDKKIAILSCMDTRLTALLPAALGIKNGDVKMIKNAGGRTGCPKDAVKKIKKMVDYISEYNGGEGAVRDYIEWLLAVQAKTLISNYK